MFPEFRKHGNIRSLSADKAIDLRSAILVDLAKLGTDSGDKLLFPLQTAVAGLAGDSSTKTRLAHVFRQCEVMDSKDARQRGDHAPRVAPKQMIAGIYHMFSFMTGRTSTAPSTSKIGQPLERSTPWSRSRASISV